MSLDRTEVRRIADLARLRLSAEEEATFQAQLSEIVGYIASLSKFDEGSITGPEKRLLEVVDAGANDVPRTDDADEPMIDGFLENAPLSLDRFLVVPQVKATPSSE